MIYERRHAPDRHSSSAPSRRSQTAKKGILFMPLFLGDMGRSEEAISEMKKALEADPLSVLLLDNVGSLYGQAGQPEKAVEQYRKILEINPKSD